MSYPTRQNSLFVSEDWTKIRSDFPVTQISHMTMNLCVQQWCNTPRNNYIPEDFNDYIESPEFVAPMDLIAYFDSEFSI